jgi:hypothetical protein
MKLSLVRGWAAFALAAFLTLASRGAGASDVPISVGEVVAPNATVAGVDAASLRDTAEGAIRQLDPAELPGRHRYVLSLALTGAAVEGPVACTVDAMVRDAKTGNMIAIIQGGARAEGPASAELRRQVAHAAVRSAVRRIPSALAQK